MNGISAQLFKNKDEKYKFFLQKLVPDTKLEIIGVRVPIIKNVVKNNNSPEIIEEFLAQKHTFYEEWMAHGIAIGWHVKEIERVFCCLDEFLDYLDNWAICDSTVSALKIFNKYPEQVLGKVKVWLSSDKPYIVRFAVVVLLNYFLDRNFSPDILLLVQNTRSNNYYVDIAIAWFYSVALIKQYKYTIDIIEHKTLPRFIQNKTIQKAKESFRINQNIKKYLIKFKI